MTLAATTPLPNATGSTPGLEALRDAGAADFDAVGWHYIEVLAERITAQKGAAQGLLQTKLEKAVGKLHARMAAASHLIYTPAPLSAPSPAPTSPLAKLLQELAPPVSPAPSMAKTSTWRGESPRVQQFRKTLSKLSVQKQVSHAIAQAPQNAGPINSHMLVLRSLGLMRELSPDYLNRFMAYVDTLLCLEEAGKAKPLTKKTAAASKLKK
jgi:Protein of unknown function (DUF2894)